jgi:hypothetical protein
MFSVAIDVYLVDNCREATQTIRTGGSGPSFYIPADDSPQFHEFRQAYEVFQKRFKILLGTKDSIGLITTQI